MIRTCLAALLLIALPKEIITSGFSSSGDSKVCSSAGKKLTIYTTALNTDYRMTQTGVLAFRDFSLSGESQACVFIDTTHTFQTFLGIGGAITDASAETFAKLPKDIQQEILTAYYDAEKGIGYTLARTSIHSSDFSSSSYNYTIANDKDLKTFSVAHDKEFRIPLIKKAMAAAGGKFTLFASPWSPPAWMKDNNNMLKGGKLLPQFRQPWANYFVKFIEAYEKEGIPVWGISVQNEPMAIQKWESCVFTADEERDFIRDYLGPTLQKNKLGSKKLIAWDHNRDLIYHRAMAILNDPEAAKYVWGLGFHWYETWTGGEMQFENLKRVKESFPDINLLFTEGCAESFNADSLNSWTLGEKYGLAMIGDFNSGTVGWTDWNILVDEKGGPNHVGNFCHAPLVGNTKTGKLHYENSYYYIGHFSKFIRPGAKRIAASSNRARLLTTSFINQDGKIVVVVMNRSNEKMSYNLCIGGQAAETTSLPRSITTLIIE
jgi:glucosylceramidase